MKVQIACKSIEVCKYINTEVAQISVPGADPGFFKGGSQAKAMVIYINYIIYILQLFTLLF